MRLSAYRLSASAVVVLLGILGWALPEVAAAEEARIPRSAFNKQNREDLATPLREQGEIRVIVGLRRADQAANRLHGRGNDAADRALRREVDEDQTRLLQRHQRHNLRHVKRFREHHFVAMTVDAVALENLLADPDVTSVAEDRPLYPVLQQTPGITRADKAWTAGYKGAGQVVAVIDSGIDKNHPFLAGKVVAEACFSDPVGSNTSYCPNGASQSTAPGSGLHCPDSSLTCWHGTHVAGIVAGKYGVLSSTTGGIAPEANLIAIQVFQKICGTSSCAIEAYNSDIALALEHVYSLRNTHNIAAVNMSLGGDNYTATCDDVSPAMTTIINNLRSANIATVIASGNSGRADAISFPACISSAVSVGSTNKQNAVSSFSNSSSFLSLLAPGGAVTSSTSGGGYIAANGTSMATPHVAGAWAILKAAKPTATVDEALAALQSTGTPVTDTRNGIVKPLIQIGYDGTQLGALGQVLGHGNVPPSVALTSPANGASSASPATMTLAANASDSDGSITKVEFFQGTTKVGEVLAPGPYSFIWENVGGGTYALTARATDNLGGTSTSSPVSVTVTGSTAVSVNVAAQVNGGVASASSIYPGYPAAKAINGGRKSDLLSDGTRDFWFDGNSGGFPDWLQVNFNGVKTIGQIDIFTLQDNWTSPVEPTPTMTITKYGITNFNVQYWNGTAWLSVPGGNITGNNLVWRRLTFAPISTDRIRVTVTAGLGNTYSRITEIEAWTATGGSAGDTAAPSVPTGLAATGTTSSATTLAWNPSSDNVAVTGYKVFRNGAEIATVTSGTSYPDAGLSPSTSYSYTVAAFDAANNTSAQSAALPVMTSSAGNGQSINVALQANGGVASASSIYPGYPAAKAINGGRKSDLLSDGTRDFWFDGNSGGFPDWLQVNFNGVKTIGQIDIFTLQDNWTSPVEPTPTMTITKYGITNFNVQYWNGTAWLSVPGGNITGNNLVWRRLTFAPISTDRIRVTVTAGLGNTYSRITEIEAWTATGGSAGDTAAPSVPTGLAATGTTSSATTLAWNPSSDNVAVTGYKVFRNGAEIATVTSGTSYPDAGLSPSTSYSYTVAAFDAANNTSAQSAALPVMTSSAGNGQSINVALQANGGVASASSIYPGYPAAKAINGGRKSDLLSDGTRDFWFDGNSGGFPDWLQVNFNGVKTIGQIDIFTLQDNWTSPVEPTPTMTITKYGITNFNVQYWNGTAWLSVPGGNITGNNLVWRRLTFAPISTDRIRVTVTAGLGNTYSRITEIEAWTVASSPTPPTVALQSVATGLSAPVDMTHARDGSGRLFIVQQGGQIKILSGGQILPASFLDIQSLLVSGGERGLLGLAFHPNYAANGYFYVNYTRQSDGATVIARYQRSSANPNLADPASASILLTVPQPFTNHKGGQLRFGPDGYLYIGLGDGGSGNDPGNRAQDLTTLLGKMLRIDVDSAAPYAIPAGNPFQNDGNPATLPEIWAYGLRNPWRFSFDRLTGDLFIADVGQSAWEEINFQAAGTGAGANYGWRAMEGAHCTGLGGGPACFDPSLTLPILEYGHELGCSVTGGHRYRGASYPSLAGYFVFGDYCSGRIWGATNASGTWSSSELLDTSFNISTFGEDEAGELYVASYGTGVIYRISAP